MYAKELQTGHHLNGYDYGARYYDPSLARWTTQDPLSEQYLGFSTYHYTKNNPIRFYDIQGMSAADDIWKQMADSSQTEYLGSAQWHEDQEKEKEVKENNNENENNSNNKHFSEIFANLIYNGIINTPFKGAAAISINIGGNIVGGEKNYGYYFVLIGEDAGRIKSFNENAGGGSSEISLGLEIGRVDFTGIPNYFHSNFLFGFREKGWIGAGEIFGGSSKVSWSHVGKNYIISNNISIGFSVSIIPGISIGYNRGNIEKIK